MTFKVITKVIWVIRYNFANIFSSQIFLSPDVESICFYGVICMSNASRTDKIFPIFLIIHQIIFFMYLNIANKRHTYIELHVLDLLTESINVILNILLFLSLFPKWFASRQFESLSVGEFLN